MGFGATKINAAGVPQYKHSKDKDAYTNIFGSRFMQEVPLNKVNHSSCRNIYQTQKIGAGQIRADAGGRIADTCGGDSGGPLIAYDESGCPHLVGTVSWGQSCAEPKHPGIYTSVAHFRDWIVKLTEEYKLQK